MENRDKRDNDNLSRKDQPKDASETSREVASRRQQQGDSEVDSGEKTAVTRNVEPNNRNSRRTETEH
jgi:hypothetical protein